MVVSQFVDYVAVLLAVVVVNHETIFENSFFFDRNLCVRVAIISWCFTLQMSTATMVACLAACSELKMCGVFQPLASSWCKTYSTRFSSRGITLDIPQDFSWNKSYSTSS
jgi:hypothetical protein